MNTLLTTAMAVTFVLAGVIHYFVYYNITAWKDLQIQDFLKLKGQSCIIFNAVVVFGWGWYLLSYMPKVFSGMDGMSIMFASLFVWVAVVGKDSTLFRNM